MIIIIIIIIIIIKVYIQHIICESKEVLFFQPSRSNRQYCKLGAEKFFPFVLTFLCQLILGEGIFGTTACLITYFLHQL